MSVENHFTSGVVESFAEGSSVLMPVTGLITKLNPLSKNAQFAQLNSSRTTAGLIAVHTSVQRLVTATQHGRAESSNGSCLERLHISGGEPWSFKGMTTLVRNVVSAAGHLMHITSKAIGIFLSCGYQSRTGKPFALNVIN